MADEFQAEPPKVPPGDPRFEPAPSDRDNPFRVLRPQPPRESSPDPESIEEAESIPGGRWLYFAAAGLVYLLLWLLVVCGGAFSV